MSLTALALRLDRSEYSRFERDPAADRSRVVARVYPTPATALDAEVVTVNLVRANGVVVATQDITLTGTVAYQAVTFDLNAYADSDGIPLCVRGAYTVEAVQGEVSASADMLVSILTVEAMRAQYCQGATLFSSEVFKPLRQPLVVSGVRITQVSEKVRPGVHTLVYDQLAGTLAFDGGAVATLAASIGIEYLPDTTGGYVEVTIDRDLLPGGGASEGVIIDKERMSDEVIRAHINQSVAEVENVILKVFVEPQRCATEPFFSAPEAGEWFDREVEPIAFTRQDFNPQAIAWHLHLPLRQLLKVSKIEGYMGNTRVLEVSSGALAAVKKSGTVDILPYSSQYAYLYHFFTHMNFWGVRDIVANFWRYKAVAGLDRLDAEVIKLIGYTAAIPILGVAGQAYRGGYASESNSKDGVSQSRSYTSSAMYGIYSATINGYMEWIKLNASRIANKYRGIPMVVL